MAFKTIIEGVTEESQSIIDDFLGHYGSDTYPNLIRKISVELGIKDFTQMTFEHRQILMDKYKESNMNSSVINSLFEYLYLIDVLKDKHKFVEIYGDREKIRKRFARLKNKEAKQNKTQKDLDSTLSFVQVEKLIEYCKEVEPATDFSSYKNLRMAFAFYAMFFWGISVNGLKNMDIKTYSNGELVLDERIYKVPEKYYSMFEYAIDNAKAGKYQYLSKNIEDLGKMVGIDKLVPKDITMTSKKYQFMCPVCGEQYLSFGENWKTINGKIVCSVCAEHLRENDVKKNIISELDTEEIELISIDEKEKISHSISSYDKLKKKLKAPCDFETWNKYMKLIGDLGEKYVYEREIKKLLDADKPDLAELVDADKAMDHNNGYDILSYTVDGEELHIEVKSTPGPLDTSFYISQNELNKAKLFTDKGGLYEIHRVYNVGKDNISVKVYTDINSLVKEAVLYKVNVSE